MLVTGRIYGTPDIPFQGQASGFRYVWWNLKGNPFCWAQA